MKDSLYTLIHLTPFGFENKNWQILADQVKSADKEEKSRVKGKNFQNYFQELSHSIKCKDQSWEMINREITINHGLLYGVQIKGMKICWMFLFEDD